MSDAARDAFSGALFNWVEPAAVAALLAPGLAADTARSALTAERLRPRLCAWLDGQFGRVDGDALAGEDGAVMMALVAEPERRGRLARYAGAVWHAPTIRAMLLASEIAAFTERFGPQTRRVALLNMAARPTFAPATAIEMLEHDGGACIAAWLGTLPASVRDRLLLGWSAPLPEPGEDHAAHGPAIVRLLAAELAQ